MELTTLMYRFVVVNALTAYYSLMTLLLIGVIYVKSFFTSELKLKLEPPACLFDKKYGLHKYIKVNGIKLHYVESGDPSKPLMVLVHGFPEFWYSWRHQIVDFQKDYWCIAVDMRGYGDSERPEGVAPYHLDVLIEDIKDLIRQLGREKCILVTHDWGGIVGARFRDVYPEMLTCLVMLASMSREAWHEEVWSNPNQMKKSWYIYMYRFPGLAEWILPLNNISIFDDGMLVPGKDTITAEDIECYKYWFGKQCAFTPPVNYYRANLVLDLPKKQCKGNVPMLVIYGGDDRYIETSILEVMKREYNNIETKIIDNCGHFLQQEEPVEVNRLIREFLAKQNLNSQPSLST